MRLQELPNMTELLQSFALQRKPFVTLADVLENMYQDFGEIRVAPFDFTVLEQRRDHQLFRFILSYSREKISSILHNSQKLTALVDDVFRGTERERVDMFYRDLIRSGRIENPVEWITGVFHLSFSYQIPIQFNPGRVLEVHEKYHRSLYRARLLAETDVAGFPRIKIEDRVYQQVDERFKPDFEKGMHFYQDWVSIVQNLKSDSSDAYNYHLYVPVYDGPVFMQGALRGFLGFYFSDEISRKNGVDFFLPRMDVYQNQLNNAFKEGIQNHVIDGYIDAGDDPLLFWKDHLHFLHNWKAINIESGRLFSDQPGLWHVRNNAVYIPLFPLLQRKKLEWQGPGEIDSCYQNKCMVLELPELSDVDLSRNISYIRDRIVEIVGLLDAIFEKRRLLQSLENSKNAGRRSAVAVVMSRNMSHNIGSHVLAGLSSAERFGNVLPGEIARLNSYLRTRMDFLADISTAGSSVTMPRRFYQDVCTEFKLNQQLLLDHISGTSLRGDRIKFIVTFNGKKITTRSLESDPIISLPNDVLGAQAFYVILENMVRNSAKHAVVRDTLRLCIQIDDMENSAFYYRVRVNDNLNTLAGRSDLVPALNTYIDGSIIKDDGTLRMEAWGMMEMKIAAAYLRKIEPEHIDDAGFCPGYKGNDKQLPLLKACDLDGNLGYEFFLLKPHKVLVVAPDADDFWIKMQPDIRYWGVDVVTVSQMTKNPGPLQNVEHELMLFIDPEQELLDHIKANRQFYPLRILYVSKDQNISQLPRLAPRAVEHALKTKMVSFYAFLWREYIKWLWGNVPEIVNVLAVEESGETRTNRYDPAQQGGPPRVVFDLHGDYYKIIPAKEKGKVDRLPYYQAYGSASPTGLILSRLAELEKDMRDWIVCELLEAAFTRVAIVDERIQYEAYNRRDKYCEQFSLLESLRRMKIAIPGPDINLFKQRFSANDRCNIRAWIERHVSKEMTHFIIIHLGIIEKLVGTGRKEIARWIEEHLKNAAGTQFIITSGRGTPANLPDVLFLSYSLLARYTLDQTSKYHLTKVLFSARGKQS